MTDTSPEPEVSEDEDNEDLIYNENDYCLYVEIESRMIFEVKLFEDFALVRPASPPLYRYIRRLSHIEFAKQFEEFYGDHDHVKSFLRGDEASELEIFQ